MSGFSFGNDDEDVKLVPGADGIQPTPSQAKPILKKTVPAKPIMPKPPISVQPMPPVKPEPTVEAPSSPAPVAEPIIPAVIEPITAEEPIIIEVPVLPIVEEIKEVAPEPEKFEYIAPAPVAEPIRETVSEPVVDSTYDYVPSEPAKEKRQAPKNKINKPVVENSDSPFVDTIPEEIPSKKAVTKKDERKNRGKVIYLRAAVLTTLGVLCLGGIYGFVKPSFSLNAETAGQITSVVKGNLGLTDFPSDRATSFVLGFANAYLNVDYVHNNERENELKKYVPAELMSQLNLSATERGGQKVVFGPVISGVETIDNNNAIITVYATVAPLAAKTISPGIYANATNVVLQIPVYYTNAVGEAQTYQMAISAPPSFVPWLTLATVPNDNNPTQWTVMDTSIGTDEFKTNLATYLKAWASSDTAAINTYTTPDATFTAKTGLGGKFVYKDGQILELTIQGLDDQKPLKDVNQREARVTVLWQDAKNLTVTYTQEYRMIIKKQADGKWNVYDIGSMFKKRISDAVNSNYASTN